MSIFKIPQLTIPADSNVVETIQNLIFENRYSRIPVYEDTIDHIVGILHTRDFIEEMANNNKPDITIIPVFLVFLGINNTNAVIIQIIPPFPSDVISFII